jgi:NAD(P)-dependent dehydrogenase (short-subunit alcohol dehydrogenase family)
MNPRFQDQVCVVTGAASGIGLATAKLLASEGAIVAINDVRPELAEAGAQAVREAGGRAFAIPGDVSRIEDVHANVETVLAEHGHIDILVNNAGLFDVGPTESVSVERWRRSMGVNLDGTFFWAQAVAVRSMIPRRRGRIVNVSSPAGLAAIPNNIGYVASKHAVVGLTKSLAVEWGRHGIHVNALCPGVTESEMVRNFKAAEPVMFADRQKRIPIGRSAQPEEQAHAIAFLLSAEASYVNGLIMNVDGGMHALFAGYSIQVDPPAAR